MSWFLYNLHPVQYSFLDQVLDVYKRQKFGCVLRIESTCNDISTFRVEREVQHRDGTSDIRKAPLKKSIYSLYQLFTILKSANYRYLEFISSFDDHSSGRKKLDEVSHSRREKERTYRGFNFFDSRDLSVLEAISKGEYMTFGIQGKSGAYILIFLMPKFCHFA